MDKPGVMASLPTPTTTENSSSTAPIHLKPQMSAGGEVREFVQIAAPFSSSMTFCGVGQFLEYIILNDANHTLVWIQITSHLINRAGMHTRQNFPKEMRLRDREQWEFHTTGPRAKLSQRFSMYNTIPSIRSSVPKTWLYFLSLIQTQSS